MPPEHPHPLSRPSGRNRWGRDLYPLERFPPVKQEKIAELVALPEPPPKWIRLAGGEIRSRAWYEWYHQRGVNPDSLREKIPRAIRQAVLERDGFVCGICGSDVEPSDVHIDHVVPVVLGGHSVLPNLQVAHSSCNLSKGGRA